MRRIGGPIKPRDPRPRAMSRSNSVQIDLGAIRFCNCTIARCGDNWNCRVEGALHIHRRTADVSADGENSLELNLVTVVVAFAGTFLIAFMKGGFGGGFAIIGIPLLSIVMDPLTAGAFLAPLFVAQDLVALRYWKPSTWSKPDLSILVPALLVGIAARYVTLTHLDKRAVAIVMAVITLVFTALWFRSGGKVAVQPLATPKAIAAGFGSGLTTMVA